MQNHLAIYANNSPLVVSADTEVSIDLQNPITHDEEMYSYAFLLPFDGNRDFLGNVDDHRSDVRPVSLEHTPMRIMADGIPLFSGIAVVQPDERLEDGISISVDAAEQSFRELIGDLECRDIPLKDRILIGEKVGEVKVTIGYDSDVTIKYEGKKGQKNYSAQHGKTTTATFEPQALGFSYPGICQEGTKHQAIKDSEISYPDGHSVIRPKVTQSFINVDRSYAAGAPYCNARVCYKHYDIEDGKTSQNLVQKDDGKSDNGHGPIWVLDADRPQSGLCFYILYFLDCLFAHLGLQFDKSALTEIGDLNRLCFFTTHCKFDTEHYDASSYTFTSTDKDHLFDDVNAWLSSRGCGGKLALETPKKKNLNDFYYTPIVVKYWDDDLSECTYEEGTPTRVVVGENEVESIVSETKVTSASATVRIAKMYANSDNFPDVSVADVIDSLENQFGIKFFLDYEQRKVTAYLKRDLFRKKAEPRPFKGTVLSMTKITEKITGVRVGYSAESDSKEQRANVKNKIKDYDTDYDYIEYPQNRTVTNMEYAQIIEQVVNENMKVYVDLTTGNAYRIKIDSDYTDASNMEPRLFEVGAHHGVELGDCSAKNEDFVEKIESGFTPVPLLDVNYRRAAAASNADIVVTDSGAVTPGYKGNAYLLNGFNASDKETILAALVDEDMEHEFIEHRIKNVVASPLADFYVSEVLSMVESYDPSNTDDGNSPLQSYDWGMCIGVMRGGGTDYTTQKYDFGYDGFGNDKWRGVSGKYALTTDTIDPYGKVYDYNGVWEGIGNEERFSLKVRAYKTPDWSKDEHGNPRPLVVEDQPDYRIKTRGWLDVFLIEWCMFLLRRRKFYVRALCSVAELVDIKNHWLEWWNIDGHKCLIDVASATINTTTGISETELEVYEF